MTWTDLYLRIPIVVRYVIFRTFSMLSESLSSAPLPTIPPSLPLLVLSKEGSVGVQEVELEEGLLTNSQKNIENKNENKNENIDNTGYNTKNENIKNVGNGNENNNENVDIVKINVYRNEGDEKYGRVRGDNGGEGAGSRNVEYEDGIVTDNNNNNNNYNNDNDNDNDDNNNVSNINVNAVTTDPRPSPTESTTTSFSPSSSIIPPTSPSVSSSPSVSVSVSSSQSSILVLLRVMVKMRATRGMIGDKAIIKIAETVNLVLNSQDFSTSFSTPDNSESFKSYQKLSILVKSMIASSAKNSKSPIVLPSVKNTENVHIPFILPIISGHDDNDGIAVNSGKVKNNGEESIDEIEKDGNNKGGKEREGAGRDGGREVRVGEREGDRDEERERERDSGVEGVEKLYEECWAEGMCDALTLLLEH